MNRKLVFTLLVLSLGLATFVASASAQSGGDSTGPEPIIIPGDGTIIIRKVVVGTVPAADWAFTGSFSFTLPAAGGEITIYTSEGTYTFTETAVAGYGTSVSCNTGESGTSSVTVGLSDGETITCTFTNTSGGTSSASLYVSPLTAGNVGGVAATPQDILFRNGPANTWAMHFDGSDVGVTKIISAFARLSNGDLLLVLKANQTLPGVGAVTPWDVVRFSGTYGPATSGTFSWYIDGSDPNVGLTTTAEKIDALDVLSDGRVLISTAGALSVPKPGGVLKSQDEDLSAFTPTQTGDNTTGSWAPVPYFNGTAVPGLGAEDVVGAHVDEATGDLYLGVLGAFNVGGVSGNGKDVMLLHPTGGGAYAVSHFWRGPNHGFNLNLGGIELD